jgi:GT2 family glycosyltransferase
MLLLPEILPQLYVALKNSNLTYEIIIVDDFSTDDSVTLIKNKFTDIKLLESKINLGFSPTVNKGIFASQYDLILILNSDVKLSPNYFEKQLSYFDMEDTFGVMGRIVGWDDDTIQDGGKYPSFHGVKIKTSGNYYPIEPMGESKLFSMYLSGANALVSAEKIKQLGGFDEIFAPFYVEDTELSIRAWRIGWKCYYEHDAICRHKTSTTIKSKSSKNFVKKIYYRNKMFLHVLHLQNEKLFVWYLQLLPEMFIHFITGRFWFFGSLKMFFTSKRKINESRKKFKTLAEQRNRLLSLTEIVNAVLNSTKDIAIKRF